MLLIFSTLCPCLAPGLPMSYILSSIFHFHCHSHFLEYSPLFLNDKVVEESKQFSDSKSSASWSISFYLIFSRSQPSVAYEIVAYKKKHVCYFTYFYYANKIEVRNTNKLEPLRLFKLGKISLLPSSHLPALLWNGWLPSLYKRGRGKH